MAVNYTDLFEDLGKLVAFVLGYRTIAADRLPADLDEVADQFEINGRRDVIDGLAPAYDGFKDSVLGWQSTLVGYASRRLTHLETILNELGVSFSDTRTVLDRLIEDFALNAHTVKRSTVTLSPETYRAGNYGTGRLFATKVLDGVSPPGLSMPAHVRYNGVDSELAPTADTFKLVCTSDNPSSNVTEGRETFRVEGKPQNFTPFDWRGEGIGQTSIQPAHAQDLYLSNKDWENWTSTNTPSAPWAVSTGTPGTHIFRESTTKHRGTYGLKLSGTGALAAIKITQALSIARLQGRARYFCGGWLKADASIAAGDFLLQLEGTGYTAATGTPEVQTVVISGTPTGGTYTLSWRGQTTAAIAYNANSATVQAALRLLRGLECITIAESGSTPNYTHTITFHGVCPLDLPDQLTSTSSLTGGSPLITHATTTPGVAGERVFLPPGALPTSFIPVGFFVNLPIQPPSDLKLIVQWGNTPTNAKNLYFDSTVFTRPTYVAGVGLVLLNGSTPWVLGDQINLPVANDNVGQFQRFFREAYGVQFPSATSPTIDDSLAEANDLWWVL